MAEKYDKDMTPEEKAARKQQRMDELQTQREAGALQRALTRATTDSKYNFTQRPEGYIDEGNKVIRYYGWNNTAHCILHLEDPEDIRYLVSEREVLALHLAAIKWSPQLLQRDSVRT